MAGHKETIAAGAFDDKFKNALRDYYTYGFYSYQELLPSGDEKTDPKASTLSNDWDRLRNILSDQFEWSVDRNRAFFLSTDSQSQAENPFHRVYRFCRYNSRDPKYFFLTCLTLSPYFRIRNGFYGLKMGSEAGWETLSETFEQNKRTASEILCFDPETPDPFSDSYSAFRKRLQEWKTMGFLETEDELKRIGSRWMHYWALNQCTPDMIIQRGKRTDSQFLTHFLHALDFFSRYAPLGEVGSFLLARCQSGYDSPFRFKHTYFAQALNDFNLIDLLDAMEHKKWCRICYRKSTQSAQKEFVCKPVQIRISVSTGREYLICYDLKAGCYTNLRLEYIDSIAWCALDAQMEQAERDMDSLEQCMRNSWGVSPAGKTAELRKVTLKIRWDPRSERYLLNRLKREKRIGRIQEFDDCIVFTAWVADVKEMYPWIRSLYSRLLECSGVESRSFCMEQDLRDMLDIAIGLTGLPEPPKKAGKAPEQVPADKPFKVAPWQAHHMVFHEVFSVYYMVIADVLMTLASSESAVYSQTAVQNCVQNSIKKYSSSLGKKSAKLLEKDVCSFVKSEVFMEEGCARYDEETTRLTNWYSRKCYAAGSNRWVTAYRSRFLSEKGDFYREILPLSRLECRWLKTILEDPKISLFLSDDEIDAIRDCLGGTEALPADRIHYMDRSDTAPEHVMEKRPRLQMVLDAICGQKKLRVTYRPDRGNIMEGIYLPAVVEYSMRNDVFRIHFFCEETNRIITMNLERIVEIAVLENESFSLAAVRERLREHQRHEMEKLTITFTDRKNTADRILNELSPWRKRCYFDRTQRVYTMTLYYPRQDYLELVVRLLGYGPVLQIRDKQSPVYEEYVRRIQDQLRIEYSRVLDITTL